MIALLNEECAINIDHIVFIEYDKKKCELTFNMINNNKILFKDCSEDVFIDFLERINERDRRNNKRDTKR